jgi:hypothetical protein
MSMRIRKAPYIKLCIACVKSISLPIDSTQISTYELSINPNGAAESLSDICVRLTFQPRSAVPTISTLLKMPVSTSELATS